MIKIENLRKGVYAVHKGVYGVHEPPDQTAIGFVVDTGTEQEGDRTYRRFLLDVMVGGRHIRHGVRMVDGCENEYESCAYAAVQALADYLEVINKEMNINE